MTFGQNWEICYSRFHVVYWKIYPLQEMSLAFNGHQVEQHRDHLLNVNLMHFDTLISRYEHLNVNISVPIGLSVSGPHNMGKTVRQGLANYGPRAKSCFLPKKKG